MNALQLRTVETECRRLLDGIELLKKDAVLRTRL